MTAPDGEASFAYVYGVVPAGLDVTLAPAGIDDRAVRLIACGDIAALSSDLDPDEYRGDVVEMHLGDVQWLTPRAVAHDRVLTWASDHVAVVPFPMWTMFVDDAGVLAMLHSRAGALCAALDALRDAREYVVRLFARTSLVSDHVASLSPAFAELERAAVSASPGQAYLLRRKLEAARKNEMRAVVHRVADEAYTTLRAIATRSSREPLAGEASAEGSAVLNAAFLVRHEMLADFQRAVTALVSTYSAVGFHVDFTGPWPPYHFVRGV